MGKADANCGQKSFGKTVKKTKSARKVKACKKGTKLKSNITAGSVLILLAGRFRGKRVVFLKQLASGLLLVTGPFAVNGVPIRRVNQRFCIATSTVVDVKKADFSKLDDKYFAREAGKKGKKSDSSMFASEPQAKSISADKKSGQKKVDETIVKGLNADTKSYLKARFSLSCNEYPHNMKF